MEIKDIICSNCKNKAEFKFLERYYCKKHLEIEKKKSNELSKEEIDEVNKTDKDTIRVKEGPNSFDSEDNIEKYKDYSDLLFESVNGYDGYEGILINLPLFYNLLCKISSDKKCPWSAKMLIHAAIANLVLEQDLIDDSLGPEGYLDDLFICSYVLKEIRDRISKEIILENIEKSLDKEEIFHKIYEVHEKTSFYLGNKRKQIINHLAIADFKSFDYLYKDVTTYHLDKLRNKMRLLYAMLAIKLEKILNNSISDDLKLKRHIEESPYFSEIYRYIHFLK